MTLAAAIDSALQEAPAVKPRIGA